MNPFGLVEDASPRRADNGESARRGAFAVVDLDVVDHGSPLPAFPDFQTVLWSEKHSGDLSHRL